MMASCKSQLASATILLMLLFSSSSSSKQAAPGATSLVVPCGKPSYRGARIIGGAPAQEGQFPWQVILGRYRRAVCGGAVISPNFVITAAHCLQERDSAIYRLITGTIRKGDVGVSPPSQMRKVSKMLYHPGWRLDAPLSLSNDLALLKIDRPFVFDSHTAPVCLPVHEGRRVNDSSVNINDNQSTCGTVDPTPNEHDNVNAGGTPQIPGAASTPYATPHLLVSGFGATHEMGTPSDRLLYTEVPQLSNAACSRAYPRLFNCTTMLCAMAEGGGKDSCQGDSGGPAVIESGSAEETSGSSGSPTSSDGETNEHKMILTGIVSWGVGCGRNRFPGVYTRVVYFTPWIIANMLQYGEQEDLQQIASAITPEQMQQYREVAKQLFGKDFHDSPKGNGNQQNATPNRWSISSMLSGFFGR